MAGKKRKLKKELKRKLKKNIKKDIKKKENKDTKDAESKVEKPVIDNQTLQQIMMAQMMNSRSRVSNGENTSWLATQNQKYADEIKHKKELNAMREENKELQRQRDNVEYNEKFIKLKEENENAEKMLKNKIIELEEAKKQAEKIKPLMEKVERLEKELAEKNKEINNPVRKLQMQEEELTAQIEYINKRIKDGDKKAIQERAKVEEAIKALNKRKENAEKVSELLDEKAQIEAQLQVILKPIRDVIPELKGTAINSKQLYEKLINIVPELNNQIDYYNNQIEEIKVSDQMIQTLKKTKEKYDMYEENMRKEHPLFELIYEEKIRPYGENITQANKEKALAEALDEHKTKLKDIINDTSKTNENDSDDNKSPDINNEDDNPDYKVYTSTDINNNENISSSSDNEYVTQNDYSKDDELAVASSGPGTE